MERQSTVLTTSVDFEGDTYSASYFIEGGIIHAEIGGRVLMTAVGLHSAEQSVKMLLTGHLLQQSRKTRHSTNWAATDRRLPDTGDSRDR